MWGARGARPGAAYALPNSAPADPPTTDDETPLRHPGLAQREADHRRDDLGRELDVRGERNAPRPPLIGVRQGIERDAPDRERDLAHPSREDFQADRIAAEDPQGTAHGGTLRATLAAQGDQEAV